MEISIKEKKENPLLRRTEVRFEIAFDGATPSRVEAKARVCAVLKADPDLTVIDEIRQGFGSKAVEGYAKVYADAEALKIEKPFRMRRERGEKGRPGAKAAAKPAPAKQ